MKPQNLLLEFAPKHYEPKLEFLPMWKLNSPGFGFVAFYVKLVEKALDLSF